MFDVGGGELLLIVLVVLLLFGPNKIPEIASMVGKGIRKVREAQNEITQHVRDISTDMERSTVSNQSVEQNHIVPLEAEIPDPTTRLLDEYEHGKTYEQVSLTNTTDSNDGQGSTLDTVNDTINTSSDDSIVLDESPTKLTTLAIKPQPPDNSVAR